MAACSLGVVQRQQLEETAGPLVGMGEAVVVAVVAVAAKVDEEPIQRTVQQQTRL